MINLVLFLLAIVLVIVICKNLSRKALVVIGKALLVVVGLCVLAGGYLWWHDQQNAAEYQAKRVKESQDLVTFFNDVDQWARDHADKSKEGYYTIDNKLVQQYAYNLKQARNYSFMFNTYSSLPDNEGAISLDQPLDGVKEIKVACDAGFWISSCTDAVKKGYRGGFMLQIYTLDGSKVYSRSRGWVKL